MSEKVTSEHVEVQLDPDFDLGINPVQEKKDGNDTSLNLTPEMHELVGNAIQASFGRQENDSGQFEPDIEYIIDKMMTLSHATSIEILQQTVEDHDNDPNFPNHTLELIKRLLAGPKVADLDPTSHQENVLRLDVAVLNGGLRAVCETMIWVVEEVDALRGFLHVAEQLIERDAR